MTPHTWTVLGQLAVLIGVFGGAIAAYRWADKHIVQPLQSVHRFTTVNGNADPENPTLRDDLSSVKKHLDRQDADIAELKAGQAADRALVGKHLGWSEEEVSRLWTAISKKADK